MQLKATERKSGESVLRRARKLGRGEKTLCNGNRVGAGGLLEEVEREGEPGEGEGETVGDEVGGDITSNMTCLSCNVLAWMWFRVLFCFVSEHFVVRLS